MTSQQLEQFEELGRRAVACKRWRWMPGMRYLVGSTSGRLTDNQCKGKLPLVAEAIPDLTDPATLGCLLALVREAWKKPHAYPMANSIGEWIIQQFDEEDGIWRPLSKCFKTEAGALVDALEKAP